MNNSQWEQIINLKIREFKRMFQKEVRFDSIQLNSIERFWYRVQNNERRDLRLMSERRIRNEISRSRFNLSNYKETKIRKKEKKHQKHQKILIDISW